MLLFKTIILAFLTIGISSCGFSPIYGGGSFTSVSGFLERAGVEIGNIPDREGQYLRNALIDRLYTNGRPLSYKYKLVFSPLEEEIVNIGIRKDASATRAQIQISMKLKLVDKLSGDVLLTRQFKGVGAYNLLDNHFATMISKRDIIENILQELANDTLTELNLYFYKDGRK